jgi:hypothetical protein
VTPNRFTTQLFARIRPGIKSAAGYDRRARNNASSRHLPLQPAAAKGRLGRPKTQITRMFPFHSGTSHGTRQESQMIDLVCARCDVDARVFYRLKRAKYLVCNIIYDAALKIIAVAKVKANIVIHICSSIA